MHHSNTGDTTGILVGASPCGIILLISELFRAESKSQVYASLHQYFSDHPSVLKKLGTFNEYAKTPSMKLFYAIGYICYDDGCHLKKYIQNPCRSNITKTAQVMAKLSIVIDCMHMKGHTDLWCKQTCDPKWFPQLNNVR